MKEFVSKLKNLESWADVEYSLSQEELNVVLAVMNELFKHEDYFPKKGTFMLRGLSEYYDGYEDDYIADYYNILSFDFPGGEKEHPCGQILSSRKIAESELREMSSRSRSSASAITCINNNPSVTYLNAENGSFLIAFFADNIEFHFQMCVYMALIRTLAKMRDDRCLQEDADHTLFYEMEDRPYFTLVVDFIDQLFEKCELQEFKTWKEWRENTEEGRGARIYFDYDEPEEIEEDEED